MRLLRLQHSLGTDWLTQPHRVDGQPHCSGQPACSRLLPHACMHQPRRMFAAQDAMSPVGTVGRAPHCSAAARCGSASTRGFCCAHATLQRVTKRRCVQLKSARAASQARCAQRSQTVQRMAGVWPAATARRPRPPRGTQLRSALRRRCSRSAARRARSAPARPHTRAHARPAARAATRTASLRAHGLALHAQRGRRPAGTASLQGTRP